MVLAQIVFGAMKRRRVSQADIGRAMETGTEAKYDVRLVSRSVRNTRVNIAEGRRALVALAAKARFTSDRFGDLLLRHGAREGGHRDLGWGPRQTKVADHRRLARPLPVLAHAYLMLLTIGLARRRDIPEKEWAPTNTKTRDQMRLFTMGQTPWMASGGAPEPVRGGPDLLGGDELGMTQTLRCLADLGGDD